MKRAILITSILAASVTCPVMADLQVYGNDSEIGKRCYSDNNNTALYKINDPSGKLVNNITEFDEDACPDSYSDWTNNNGACWVSYTNNALYVCARNTNSKACPYEPTWHEYFYNNDWEPIGENRVALIDGKNTQSINNYTCTMDPYIDYGCAAGFYTTATTPNATMTCTRCPSSGGIYGTSEIGNTSITGCYIPNGTSYNDGTGNVTLSGDCYYTK